MRLLPAATLAALLILAACNGGSPGGPSSTPSPTTGVATPSATTHGSAELDAARFEPARALAHVEALADDIGPRPAGEEGEREAARYLRDQLQDFGYDAELQPFSFDVFTDAGSSLEVLSPSAIGGLSPAVVPFNPSTDGLAQGQLVEAGMGHPRDFHDDTSGKVALIQRGTLRFADKLANAAAAGAVGAVIYNNEPGLFGGLLSDPPAIPSLSISQEDGEALLTIMRSGPVSVRLEVLTLSGPRDSQNVAARPPDGTCRVVAGGHYDTVAAGPGANDNGSGTATVVEMARVLAADGEFDDVCFVLFGAEEAGLIGSASFVDSLTSAESDTLEGMLNFDMVGTGRQWLFTGSPSLTDAVASEADARGLDYTVENPEAPATSDHASFINAGIPAVFLHGFSEFIADDPNYHTAGDEAQHVQPTKMAEIAEVGLAIIQVLLSSR